MASTSWEPCDDGRMRRRAIRIFLTCALAASACGRTETSGLDAVPNERSSSETTGLETPTSIAATPSSSAPTTARPGRIEGYEAPDGWNVRRQLGVNTALLNTDRVTIESTIIGGPSRGPTDPCARNYELVVSESTTEVRATIFELLPSAPEDQFGNTICTTEGHRWRLSSTLDRPLGDRIFIDELTGNPAPLTDLATVLQPAYAPTGWELEPPLVYGSELELHYTASSATNGLLYARSAPVTEGASIDSLRARDLVQIDEITVRSLPGLRVTSLEDGAVTITWEEDGRLYQVHGYLVDPSELQAMAESMR